MQFGWSLAWFTGLVACRNNLGLFTLQPSQGNHAWWGKNQSCGSSCRDKSILSLVVEILNVQLLFTSIKHSNWLLNSIIQPKLNQYWPILAMKLNTTVGLRHHSEPYELKCLLMFVADVCCWCLLLTTKSWGKITQKCQPPGSWQPWPHLQGAEIAWNLALFGISTFFQQHTSGHAGSLPVVAKSRDLGGSDTGVSIDH